MSSIGRSQHLKCSCGRTRPYWSDHCAKCRKNKVGLKLRALLSDDDEELSIVRRLKQENPDVDPSEVEDFTNRLLDENPDLAF